MQLLKVFALGLVSGACAAPLVKRDAGPMLAAFADINKSLQSISVGITGLTATSDTKAVTADLTARSQALQTVLKNSAVKVTAAPSIGLLDAPAVVAEATKLSDLTNKVISGFLAKKDIIAKAGQTQLVNSELKNQAIAAKVFIDAVVARTPPMLSSAAAEIAGYITTAINKGITGFS